MPMTTTMTTMMTTATSRGGSVRGAGVARSAPRQIMCETSSSSSSSSLTTTKQSKKKKTSTTTTTTRRQKMGSSRCRSIASSASSPTSSSTTIAVVGQETSTGKLVMGLSAGRGDEAHVSVVFGEKMENADEMTEGMDDAMFAKRFYCSKEQFAKISSKNVEGGAKNAKTTTYIFCHESGAKQMKAMQDLKELGVSPGNDDKCVLLSRVGINRKSKEPFKTQNAPYQKRETVQIGQIALPIGNAIGEPTMGTLDGYEQSEQMAKEIFGTENVTTVRSGELRGNGPLLLADLSARLVDNMYDVKFQDLYAFQGDSQQGYTKRLNLAQTLVRIAENPSCVGSVRDVSVLSVVCKTLPIVGEQTVSEPTDRERRKGYDMSKGVAPPVIDVATVDSLLANPQPTAAAGR